MRTILRRSTTRDANGRVLTNQTERLTDDGNGRIQVTQHQPVVWCSGCRRPVSDLSELLGRCDCCGVRGVCTRCETKCCACSRRLCGRCRRGFAGQTPMTACPICLERLRVRQVYLDRIHQQQLALQQRNLQHQQWWHSQQLRLHMNRLQASSVLAAARDRNRTILALLRKRLRGRYLR